MDRWTLEEGGQTTALELGFIPYTYVLVKGFPRPTQGSTDSSVEYELELTTTKGQ
jgi:hypothetical protein